MAGATTRFLGATSIAFILERCVELDGNIVKKVKEDMKEAGMQLYAKVAPTLVLFPRNEGEIDTNGNPILVVDGSKAPDDLRTLLKDNQGRFFQEALLKVRGKALLLNFCSPSVEMYPKDKKGCEDIYDWPTVTNDHVPETALANENALRAYFLDQFKRMGTTRSLRGPLSGRDGEPELNYSLIGRAMKNYRQMLQRGPAGEKIPFGATGWRMAWNDEKKTRVLALKLTQASMKNLLAALGSNLPLEAVGGRVYREESYSKFYEFGEDDYLIIDLAVTEHGHALKFDKNGKVVVRTVNVDAFEYTYAPLGLHLG